MKGEIVSFTEKLSSSMSAENIHNLVYTIAKEAGVSTSDLFKAIYLCLISKDHGPRLGKLIVAIGVERVKKTLTCRDCFENN
jgi:lysyl-tRNA synthetase class I